MLIILWFYFNRFCGWEWQVIRKIVLIMGYRSSHSTGYVFRINKDSLIMKCIRIFGDRCELNIVLLSCDFWIHKKVQVIMGIIVIPCIWGLVELLLPIWWWVLGSVDNVVLNLWNSISYQAYCLALWAARMLLSSGNCYLNCCWRSSSISLRKVCL